MFRALGLGFRASGFRVQGFRFLSVDQHFQSQLQLALDLQAGGAVQPLGLGLLRMGFRVQG